MKRSRKVVSRREQRVFKGRRKSVSIANLKAQGQVGSLSAYYKAFKKENIFFGLNGGSLLLSWVFIPSGSNDGKQNIAFGTL